MTVNKQLKQEVLNQYCMEQLGEILEFTPDDPDYAAYRVALVISYAHDDIDELKLSFYLSSLPSINTEVINKLKWFAGAGFISITCLGHEYGGVCLHNTIEDHTSEEFFNGFKELKDSSEQYIEVARLVNGFRYSFWETDPVEGVDYTLDEE